MYPDLDHPINPRRIKARAMAEIIELAPQFAKNDKGLASHVRAIIRRVEREQAMWIAALDENGQPKVGSDGR